MSNLPPGCNTPDGIDDPKQESLRESLAEIIEKVAEDGLPEPRDLDVALDAILETFKAYT